MQVLQICAACQLLESHLAVLVPDLDSFHIVLLKDVTVLELLRFFLIKSLLE